MPCYKIAALFKFTVISDPTKLQQELLTLCKQGGIIGTLIIAKEGINGTIAGFEEELDSFVNGRLLSDPSFQGMEIKFSYNDEQPFYRTKITVKPEIVTMGMAIADVNASRNIPVQPKDWNDLIKDPDTFVLDTRNAYEIGIGTFENAIDPKTESFRDFPRYVQENLGDKKKKIAMFCTGGIRCEKASAYLTEQGFDSVYSLEGGILRYLEEVDEDQSLWKGECFVFDQRVAVVHGMQRGTAEFCRGCRYPLLDADRQDPLFQAGICCARCVATLSDEAKKSNEARHKQMALAKERNIAHLGYVHPGHNNLKNQDKAADNTATGSTIIGASSAVSDDGITGDGIFSASASDNVSDGASTDVRMEESRECESVIIAEPRPILHEEELHKKRTKKSAHGCLGNIFKCW